MRWPVVFELAFAALVISLLGVHGCSTNPAAGVSVDSAFRPYVPSTTQALLAVEFEKLTATAVYKRHQNDFRIPQLNAMAERLGVDPRRDLASALVVWDGSRALLLAHGNFSTGQLERRLQSHAESSKYKGFTIFSNPAGEAVTFPAKGLAIAGATTAVQTDLALSDGGVPDELRQRMRAVPKEVQIWEVSRGTLPLAGVGIRPDLQSALSNIVNYINGTTLGVGFDSGSHFKAEISCTSAEGAQRVHDALRGLIGLARLSTNDSELDLLRMWDAISIDQDRQVIRIHADLPEDLTDKLLAQLPSLRRYL